MKYSFKLANKIRTKLLLFIDEEIRTKVNNASSSNKSKENFNSICEIKTQEESFSHIQKETFSYIQENNIFHLNTTKIHNFFMETQFNTFCKLKSHLESRNNFKYRTQKTIEESKNNDVYSKNKKRFYQTYKKNTTKKSIKKFIKNKKRNAKEYLKNLCRDLTNKLEFSKYFNSDSKIQKKSKIYGKSPRSKQLKKDIEKKETLNQSNSIDSFKIILIACDY